MRIGFQGTSWCLVTAAFSKKAQVARGVITYHLFHYNPLIKGKARSQSQKQSVYFPLSRSLFLKVILLVSLFLGIFLLKYWFSIIFWGGMCVFKGQKTQSVEFQKNQLINTQSQNYSLHLSLLKIVGNVLKTEKL